MNRWFGTASACLMALAMEGCVTYGIPKTPVGAQVQFKAEDIELKDNVKGTGYGFTIAPIATTAPCVVSPYTAAQNALNAAAQAAYEQAAADFVFEPRIKTRCIPLLLFEVTVAEVVGKGAVLKVPRASASAPGPAPQPVAASE